MITVPVLAERLGVTRGVLHDAASHAARDHRPRVIQVGSKRRTLYIPAPRLAALQVAVHREFLRPLVLHPAVQSCAGRGVVQNAQAHLEHAYVSLLDLEHAFPSVRIDDVRNALERFGFDGAAARLVTRLCTTAGQLPQGPSTSPMLFNLVLAPLDAAVSARAVRHGATYTRYADDLCLSGNRPLDDLVTFIVRETKRLGYQLNPSKERHWGPGGPAPTVTGIVLSNSLQPEPEFLRAVTRELWRAARGRSSLTSQQLRGRIAWVTQVDPGLGQRLTRRLGQIHDRTARTLQLAG